MVFGTFHGQDSSIRSQIIICEGISIDGSYKELVEGAYTVPCLNISEISFEIDQLKNIWPYHNDVETVSLHDNRVSLLIGSDILDAHVPLAVHRPPKNVKGPYGIQTPFGWCCVGSVTSNDHINKMILSVSTPNEPDLQLNSLISRFWEIESFRTQPNVPPPISKEDQRTV